MGQRSQIYIRHIDMDGNCQLVARYHQWDYGTRLVSRCKNLIDYIDTPCFMVKEYKSKDYAWDTSNQTKLERMIDYNPDYNDMVLGIDLIEEAKLYGYDNPFGQDNNDGVLLIDVINGKQIKYAFLDNCEQYLGDATEYLNWDCGDYGEAENYNFFEDDRYKDEQKYTMRNIKFIAKNAEVMTEEEAKAFLSYDYQPIIDACNTAHVEVKRLQEQISEMMDEYSELKNKYEELRGFINQIKEAVV